MLSIWELSKLATSLTILYVEDEDNIQGSIKEILEHIFSNVLVASNGIEGIELSKTHHIDIILSDINMPKCNGLDMIEKIKHTYPQIPTILLTGYENSDFLMRSINLGVNKYLIKPIQKKQFFEALEDCLYIISSRKKYKKEQLGLSKNIKMIAIAKLLDNITHQWRQSLSIISTSVGAILLNEDSKVKDKEIQSLLYNVDDNIKDMDKLLEGIFLNFEKEYKPENIQINSLINETILSFHKDIQDLNIDVFISCDEDIYLFTNKESLKQVLHNILENAIDAIQSFHKKNNYIKILVREENGECKIEIIDNGKGVHNSIKDDIFEPYTTTKHSYIGTGLGLYIVYMLTTKSLSGNIVNSNVTINSEQCAKFTISIPTK